MLFGLLVVYFGIGALIALFGIYRIIPDFCEALDQGPLSYILGSVIGIIYGTAINLFLWPINVVRGIFIYYNENRSLNKEV